MLKHIFFSLGIDVSLIAILWKIESLEFIAMETKIISTIIIGLGGIFVVVLKVVKSFREFKK